MDYFVEMLAVLKTKNYLCDPQNRGVEQLVARRAHNPKVVSSSLAPATRKSLSKKLLGLFSFFENWDGEFILWMNAL